VTVTTTRPKSPSSDPIDALPPAPTRDALAGPRADLARAIPRRPRVTWLLGIALAAAFAVLVTPAINAGRWLEAAGAADIVRGEPAPITVRVPPFAGYTTATRHISGGVLVARGETADPDAVREVAELRLAQPHGAVPYLAFLLITGVLAGLFAHHTQRSTRGRLLRVQVVNLALIVATAYVVKLLMLTTSLSVLVVPVAVAAMVPTLVLDRVVGLATGTLTALLVSFLVPFDVGVAVMLMVQAGAAGLMIAERPKRQLRTILVAGAVATLFTAATYPLMLYLSAGRLPLGELGDPLHSAWVASALGPALATALTVVTVPLYQLAVGEITQQKLVELEDLSHPLLKQISERAPGTWQHSLTMANMAEIAANTIGANGRLVRVGAYFHDLGKSLNPKYFIENLEPGETSPHDKLPPETSCDAIFRHVTEGIVAARKAGLHERIIDFMHMHHGNGVLEYFWAKCREQGNPKRLGVDDFRYPGVPPQSRETAILSICDAVEAAARTLKQPDAAKIDNLVQRIVYGKLHVGQLDESGLSMGDLRRITESLRETIRHANHSRIEYPWQKAQQDASATSDREKLTQTGPRLDSLDRPARPDTVPAAATRAPAEALAETDAAGATPNLRVPTRDSGELATVTTAPVVKQEQGPGVDTPAALRGPLPSDHDVTRPAPKQDLDEIVELRAAKPKTGSPPFSARELAALTPKEPAPDESDARMRRATNPVGEQADSVEVATFAAEAKHALDEATKQLVALPREAPAPREPYDSSPVIEIVDPDEPPPITPPSDPPAARRRASTLPPIKPATVPPPRGRRAPTVQPLPGNRPPADPPNVTAPPPDLLRPPAPSEKTLPGVTAPPPSEMRAPGMNYLDDMITLRPQYEPAPDSIGDVTNPEVVLPEADDPKVESTWARGLAARLDAQLEEDFGTDTPVAAPSRAELQALLDSPPDPTRKQSLEEIERLHAESRERPSQELDFTRRVPHPTSEVDDADIEAAIELAPPARRSAVGVAKKKHED
jgi:putative nucleotidyltransferase with HDIG domain